MRQTHFQFPVPAAVPAFLVTRIDGTTLYRRACVIRCRRSRVIGALLVREGVQTWAQETRLLHSVLLWFSFTFDSPVEAPSITEAHVPNTEAEYPCELPSGVCPGEEQEGSDPGVPAHCPL